MQAVLDTVPVHICQRHAVESLQCNDERHSLGKDTSSTVCQEVTCQRFAGTQGLAPHFDDVEIWVLQTEGSKRWRLYESPPEARLPAYSSPDLPEEGLGEPILDVTLEVLFHPISWFIHSAYFFGRFLITNKWTRDEREKILKLCCIM